MGLHAGGWKVEPWASQVEFCKHRAWAEFEGRVPGTGVGLPAGGPEEGLEVGEADLRVVAAEITK